VIPRTRISRRSSAVTSRAYPGCPVGIGLRCGLGGRADLGFHRRLVCGASCLGLPTTEGGPRRDPGAASLGGRASNSRPRLWGGTRSKGAGRPRSKGDRDRQLCAPAGARPPPGTGLPVVTEQERTLRRQAGRPAPMCIRRESAAAALLATCGARDERVGLYSCSCDAVIDDFGCGSRSQHVRPWLHRNDRLEWRWPS
jgi:hypothetical protein